MAVMQTSIIEMPIDQWFDVPDNPRQRNTIKRARVAKSKHLSAYSPVHRVVWAAIRNGNVMCKLDGHTRSYLWQNGLLETPPEGTVIVVLVTVKNARDAKTYYEQLDNTTAGKKPCDQVYGACRENSFELFSPLLRGCSFTTQLKIAETGKAFSGDVYSLVKKWKPILQQLDNLGLTSNYTMLIAVMLRTIKEDGVESAGEFWRKLDGNEGSKTAAGTDGVQMLWQHIENRRAQKSTAGYENLFDISGRAYSAYRAWVASKRFKGTAGLRYTNEFAETFKTEKAGDSRMAVMNQTIADEYAIYNGDSCEVLTSLPSDSIHMAVYSPPFAVSTGGALYNYSSSDRDLSNARTYVEFMEHYEYIVSQTARVLMPGRIAAVHCMDVPMGGANICGYDDFPGAIIKLHEKHGFDYLPRICIWKEPLAVRNRTMSKALAHRQICEDSTLTNVASADYLIPFRKRGENPVPVAHPNGLFEYAGEREVPHELHRYRGWTGKQTENRYSHWIWRNYASCFWDDIRIDRVLPYKEARDADDERHMHPLQLDVIDRSCVLWTNPGETVLTPFMGVGSEVYGAVTNNRKGIGIELKPAYYRQAVKNMQAAVEDRKEEEQQELFA